LEAAHGENQRRTRRLEGEAPGDRRGPASETKNVTVDRARRVYGGLIDKMPFRYLRPLLERIQKGEIDPSYIITHRLPLPRRPAATSSS
jgi:hypothetical protein